MTRWIVLVTSVSVPPTDSPLIMTVIITHTGQVMTTVIEGQPATSRCSSAPVVRPMLPGDRGALMEMLRRCSRGSLYHRFHGFSDGTDYVSRQLRTDPDIVRIAWSGPDCVGFGVLAENRGRPWDLGILVEDAWQRRGVGTLLLHDLLTEARRRRLRVVEANIRYEDAFIVRLLRRAGSVRSQLDGWTLTVEVSVEDVQREDAPR